jgi:hypothetical protein
MDCNILNNYRRSGFVIWWTIRFSFWSSGFHSVYPSFGIIAQRSCIKYHLHADDTQLYISLDPDNELIFFFSLNNLEHCIADIRLWLTQNLLRLNDNKTNI